MSFQTGDVTGLDWRNQMNWWWNFDHVTRWTGTLQEDRGGLCLGSKSWGGNWRFIPPYSTVEPVGVSVIKNLDIVPVDVVLEFLVCCKFYF